METLYVEIQYQYNRDKVKLKFYTNNKKNVSYLTIPLYEMCYSYDEVIKHFVDKYPKVLNLNIKDYVIGYDGDSWEDEFDTYYTEIIIHRLGNQDIVVMFGDGRCELDVIEEFIDALNIISNKNKYQIKLKKLVDKY